MNYTLPLTREQQRVQDLTTGETPIECSGCKRKLYTGDYREFRKGKAYCHKCTFALFAKPAKKAK